jgi:hypothetical protein
MTKIIIDEQFKAFLPALDAKTFSDLERDILEHGVRDAIVLWDGKNQYKEVDAQNGQQKKIQSTATRLANHYDVSQNTIRHSRQLSEMIDLVAV